MKIASFFYTKILNVFKIEVNKETIYSVTSVARQINKLLLKRFFFSLKKNKHKNKTKHKFYHQPRSHVWGCLHWPTSPVLEGWHNLIHHHLIFCLLLPNISVLLTRLRLLHISSRPLRAEHHSSPAWPHNGTGVQLNAY